MYLERGIKKLKKRGTDKIYVREKVIKLENKGVVENGKIALAFGTKSLKLFFFEIIFGFLSNNEFFLDHCGSMIDVLFEN